MSDAFDSPLLSVLTPASSLPYSLCAVGGDVPKPPRKPQRALPNMEVLSLEEEAKLRDEAEAERSKQSAAVLQARIEGAIQRSRTGSAASAEARFQIVPPGT